MAGLSLVVFPVIGIIGVIKHLSTPREKRTDKANTYFKRYFLGVILAWVGCELKGQTNPMIVVVMVLGGFYLVLFSGVFLFGEDPKQEALSEIFKHPNQETITTAPKIQVASEFPLSDSAKDIIASQKKMYDGGIWRNINSPTKSKNTTIDIGLDNSDKRWKYDKRRNVLWNESTKETLLSSSGLGFSVSKDYFLIYNKSKPIKIPIDEVVEAEFQE